MPRKKPLNTLTLVHTVVVRCIQTIISGITETRGFLWTQVIQRVHQDVLFSIIRVFHTGAVHIVITIRQQTHAIIVTSTTLVTKDLLSVVI